MQSKFFYTKYDRYYCIIIFKINKYLNFKEKLLNFIIIKNKLKNVSVNNF